MAHIADVRLGRQRSPEHHSGDWMTPYLRSANVVAGGLRLDEVKEMNFPPGDQLTFQLRPGDILVTEGSGSRGTVGATAMWNAELDGTICFQNTLLRIRPRSGVLPRYLYWWFQHAHASGLLAEVAGGQSILHLGAEALGDVRVDLAAVEEQRRIADFLDDQTARIDRIVAARRLQLGGLARLHHDEIDRLVWQSAETVRVKFLVVDVTSGPRGWGDLVDLTGDRPFLRIANLPRVGITPVLEDVRYVTAPSDAEARRATVEVGDVLLGITASIGEVAVVGAPLSGAAFSQHVARLRPKPGVDPEWLGWCLQSRVVRESLSLNAYGGTKVGLGLDEVRNTLVPSTALEDQAERASAAAELFAAADRATHDIQGSIVLLHEFKRSLISAAVSGEIDVSTASGRGVSV